MIFCLKFYIVYSFICNSLLDETTCNLDQIFWSHRFQIREFGIKCPQIFKEDLEDLHWLIGNDHTVFLYLISDLCGDYDEQKASYILIFSKVVLELALASIILYSLKF